MICINCKIEKKNYCKQLCATCYDKINRKRGVCVNCSGKTCRPSYKMCVPCKNKILPPNLGKRHSPESIEKIRQNTPIRRREQHSMWKGGITGWQKLERSSVEMKKWIKDVLKRDNFTCQACGIVGGKLEADHVMPFSLFPELRYDLLNGRTLCRPCHKKTFLTKLMKSQILGFQLP